MLGRWTAAAAIGAAWTGLALSGWGCGGANLAAAEDGGAAEGATEPPLDSGGADAPTAPDVGPSVDSGPALAQGLYPLAGIDQTMPQDDLAPLLSIVGNASNVGLGESVHTSGGFEAMKARVVRFLIEKGGFRVLALETPRSDAIGITGKYVETCEGTPSKAVTGMFPVFASDAMGTLLAWMCAWNESHPSDKVRFVGFDVQQPWTDWNALGAFLAQAAPTDASALMAGVSACDGPQAKSETDYWTNHFRDPYPQASLDQCTKGLDAVDAYFKANGAAMNARTSAEAVTLGHLSALGLRSWQGEKFYDPSANPTGTNDFVKAYESRDLAMAQVYETLRATYFSSQKAVLWAHNYHLMKNHPAADDTSLPSARTMGTILSQDLGAAYAPIGLSGWDVEINWPSVGTGPQPPPTSDRAVEWKLHALGRPWLLVDFQDKGVAQVLTPGVTYPYGAPASEDMLPAEQFRAAIYFDTSPPMVYEK